MTIERKLYDDRGIPLRVRRFLVGASSLLLAELLFPPFLLRPYNGVMVGSAFSFILSPPTPTAIIDAGTWAVELLFSLAILAVAWRVARDDA